MSVLICVLLSSCRAYVILKPEFAFPLSYYLIPFTGVVGMIIIVMCIVLVSEGLMSPSVFYLVCYTLFNIHLVESKLYSGDF